MENGNNNVAGGKRYHALLKEFEAQLNEIINDGGKPELVFNRRDYRGNTLEERVKIEFDNWDNSSSNDVEVLLLKDERVLAYKDLLLRIQGAIYTVNGLPIPGQEDHTFENYKPVSQVSAEVLSSETPEEMAKRLMAEYRSLAPAARRATVAKELDIAFPCPKGQEHDPRLSNYVMGVLVSESDEELMPEGYRSRGKNARKKYREAM